MSKINISDTEDGFERYKVARQRLREEVMYRREQQWKVFSWASTILLGTIAGVIALTQKGFEFHLFHQLTLIGATVAIAAFSGLRIRHDQQVARAHSDEAARLDRVFGLEFEHRKRKRKHFGHIGFICLLAAGAIAVIGYAPRVKYVQETPQSNKALQLTAR